MSILDREAHCGNPTKAELDWPAAVIAGAFQTGVLGTRSLKRRGVKTSLFDCDSSMPGFRSVYGPALRCPNPDTDFESWMDFVLNVGRQYAIKPVLIPSSDRYVSAIAKGEERLRECFLFSPRVDLQGKLADKFTQYHLAGKHRLPMPETAIVEDEYSVQSFAEKAQFPCLMKPGHFREWERFPIGHPLSHKKIHISDSPTDLTEKYRLASTLNPKVVLQEIIQGPDTNKRVYLSCYDRNGARIANALFRELRCDPVGFGPATVSEPVVDPLVDSLCDDFLRSIGYVGICEIELKWDDRDGRVKLIEANPRLSGGGDAAPYSGVDICWLNYLDLIGQPVRPVAPSTRDFRHIMLRPDGKAIPAYRRAGLLGWNELLHSYKPPLAFYDLDWKDWRYSLESIFIALKLFLTEVFFSNRDTSQ